MSEYICMFSLQMPIPNVHAIINNLVGRRLNLLCEMIKSIWYVLLGWFVLRIYVALTIFQSYRDLEAGDTQSLKSKWQDLGSNSRPLLCKPIASPLDHSHSIFDLWKSCIYNKVHTTDLVNQYISITSLAEKFSWVNGYFQTSFFLSNMQWTTSNQQGKKRESSLPGTYVDVRQTCG